MLTILSGPAEEIRRFRASPWSTQRTFATPLDDLPRFVSTFLAACPCDQGSLVTDEVVFEPRSTLELLGLRSIPIQDQWHFQLTADGSESIAELLNAALSDWIDFVFVPRTAKFALYADHDEYITFYSDDESLLASLVSSLIAAGFIAIPDYTRPSHGRHWK